MRLVRLQGYMTKYSPFCKSRQSQDGDDASQNCTEARIQLIVQAVTGEAIWKLSKFSGMADISDQNSFLWAMPRCVAGTAVLELYTHRREA